MTVSRRNGTLAGVESGSLLAGTLALVLSGCFGDQVGTRELRPTIDRSAVNWSPDGEWLTFDGKLGEDDQLFVIRTDGTGLRQITRAHRAHSHPAFTTDGRAIVYTAVTDRADGTSDRDIYTVDVQNGEERLLFGRPGVDEREPHPLPGGRVGVIVRAPDSDTDIGVWDPATDSIQIIVGGPSVDLLARWAENGILIFTSNRSGRTVGDRPIYEIFQANWDGSQIVNLGRYPGEGVGAGASSADISRDGRIVVYASDKEGLHPFDFDHWIYDTEKRMDWKIPRSPGARVGVPMIAPDGRSIAYAVDYDGDDVHEIAILDLGTLRVTHLHVARGEASG